MTPAGKKNRVIFIDLIRAFAVIMMVQGHTIDVLLGNSFRDYTSSFYSVWFFNRGMTAPIFMFTAGTVFNYLFRLNKEPFWHNPRVWKGVKRFALLMVVGYFLKYPTRRIFDFSGVTAAQWQLFWAVDVLQLIGVGILSIMVLDYISELLGKKDLLVFGVSIVSAVALFQYFEHINWVRYVNPALAGYLYKGTGSNFPVFPWLCYLHAGAVLGSYLAKHPDIFKSMDFSKKIAITGLAVIAISQIGNLIEYEVYGTSYFWTTSPNLVIFRVGYVLLLNAVFTVIARKMESIPHLIILLGRNTLLIYVVHLIILYGTPWTLGVANFWTNKFGPLVSVLLAVEMIGLMIVMVVVLNKLHVKFKSIEAS
ncbi:MAG: DUF1624 domain-containing protein [Ignavibacteria bacterium]|nr:DUF1624 domain-containing protein [Ignavibacteria bacterium]